MHKLRFTAEKLAARLRLIAPLVVRERLALAPVRLFAGDDTRIGPEVDDSAWPLLSPGQSWGRHREAFTIRADFAVPAGWSGEVGIEIDLGRSAKVEALAFLYGPEALALIDGEAVQGVDPNHPLLLLPERCWDGRPHRLALAGWTGIRDERYEFGGISLVRLDPPTRQFHDLMRLALDCIEQMGDAEPARPRLISALDAAVATLDLREPLGDSFYSSVPAALALLRRGIADAGPPLDARVFGVGHAHLDLAWLWTLAQSRKKGAQTFATVLRLMERYPEFRFSQSQPQLYRMVGERHPEVLEQIKARVAEGRWEPMGGMWVESDCNLAGAESLARQFVLGRRYFRETFGVDGSPILWLPDVFGYAAQLPQLIEQAGLSYFVTAKMSWNQYNRIPYDAFWWRGLDGTSVLTYLITTSKPGWWGATYSADLTPAEIAQTRRGQQQPELHDELMIAYGHGDGGGGPTARMLEDARQLASFPGMPRLRLGTALDFLTELEAAAGPSLPIWSGELYLELHRGTYTSQARNKRANRKMEVLLHDAEFLAAWASLQGAAYPHRELREAWELLCLNQFHDIIPGSSIGEVYADSARDYARIEAIGCAARDAALAALDAVLPAATGTAIYNPSPFARSEVIELGSGPHFVADVPAYGYLALRDGSPGVTGKVFCGPVADAADAGTHAEARWVLEHETIRLELDRRGEIVRLLHKPGQREVLAAGARANVWQLFDDRPLDWDAWDIDVFYDDAPPTPAGDATIAVVEAGGLRGSLEIRRSLEASTIVQRVVLRHGSDRIDFETEIDWRERHRLLKVAFPVAVLSPVATYDVQWGNVERPTHRNTSWDWARFETCAHKWVDLSEGDFGVSLLNDCKYGHDINDNVIRLTLLKGATFPDPDADLGEHRFTYSLLPHRNSWRDGTVREAYALNDPLIVRHPTRAGSDGRPERQALVSISSPFVAIETVKRAEDDAGIVLRAYEFGRTRGRVAIDAAFPVARAAQCDLHESAGTALDANEIAFDITPFQIVTVRLDGQHSDRKP